MPDPYELARNDFNTMLAHLLVGDGGEASALASLGSHGVDIREDTDHVYIEADLPGFKKDDVNISLENGTLTIVAEKHEELTEPPQQGQQQQPQQQNQGKQSAPEQKSEYLLRERRIQRFIRSFTLPPNVDEQNVQAKLENGVLSIVLNKLEESKPKRVQIS